MAVLGLHLCARAFSSCCKWGPLFITVRGPLTIAASLVAEHRLQTHRLSNCGSRAQLLRGMWDLPRPGARTRVPCIGRQILNHCATREALLFQMFLPTLSIEYSEVYSALQSRGKLLLNLLTHESDLLLCIRHQVNNTKYVTIKTLCSSFPCIFAFGRVRNSFSHLSLTICLF